MIVLAIQVMNFVHPGMFLLHPLADPAVASEDLKRHAGP
jgi:hypothetical protein